LNSLLTSELHWSNASDPENRFVIVHCRGGVRQHVILETKEQNSLCRYILTLTLPESFQYESRFRQNMDRAIYRFEQHKKYDWGGYPQWPVVLQVTIFNPDLDANKREPIRDESYAFLADHLLVKDRRQIPWKEDTGILKLGRVAYKRNLTDEPAWVAIATGDGFSLEFYAWQSKYSVKQVKAFVEQTLQSIRLQNLKPYWADVADQPRRAKEAREVKLTRIKEMFAAAGWPSLEPAGKIVEHEGFIYTASPNREVFGMGFKLGELKFEARSKMRVDFLLTRQQENELPRIWYFPEDGKWQVNNHDNTWIPTKELQAYLSSQFIDKSAVYFYAMHGIPFEYTEIGEFEVTVFAERAKHLRQLFEAGKLARPRP